MSYLFESIPLLLPRVTNTASHRLVVNERIYLLKEFYYYLGAHKICIKYCEYYPKMFLSRTA